MITQVSGFLPLLWISGWSFWLLVLSGACHSYRGSLKGEQVAKELAISCLQINQSFKKKVH